MFVLVTVSQSSPGPKSAKPEQNEKWTTSSSRAASDTRWSTDDHAGPSDDAHGVPVQKLAPAWLVYLSQPERPRSSVPPHQTVTPLKPLVAASSSACVMLALLRWLAIDHDEN